MAIFEALSKEEKDLVMEELERVGQEEPEEEIEEELEEETEEELEE